MVEDWYVESEDGSVSGPLSERQVSADLLSGRISDRQRVRQGDRAEWCDARRARAVFQQLAENGWYVNDGHLVFGPFTDAKVLELYSTNHLSNEAQLRQGMEGPWMSAELLLSQWRQQQVSGAEVTGTDESAADGSDTKWSIAPIRHAMLDLHANSAIEACRNHERLLLQDVAGEGPICITRTNGQPVGALSQADTREVRSSFERGVMHLVFLLSRQTSGGLHRIAIVFCPPGIDAASCREYIDHHFSVEAVNA